MIEFEEAKERFLQEHPDLAEDSDLMKAFLTILLLFGAAAEGCTRKEKKGLYDARLLLKNGKPLQEVADAIFEAKGPDWDVPQATMEAIDALAGGPE